LWDNRGFRSYWAAQAVSQFGDRVTELALPIIAVVGLHASPTEVGILTAAVWAPYLISFFVGSWVDHRQHKRRLLVIADVLRAAVLLTIPAAALLGTVTYGQLLAVALLNGAGEVLFNTSSQPVFVSLVPRSQYIEANSRLSSTRSISYIAGPAVGGALIQVLTAPLALLVDALTFLCSARFLGRIPLREKAPDRAGADRSAARQVWRSSVEGLRFITRHRYLRASLATATTVNFFTFLGTTLLVLFASRDLDLSAGQIGLAFGVGAVGALLGALLAPRLSSVLGAGRVIVIGSIVFPLALAVPVLANGPTWLGVTVLAAAEFVSGVGVMLFDVPLNSLQTSITPDAMRSRVAGAFSTINYGVRPIGAVTGGVLGSLLGIRPTLVIAAVGGAMCCLWLLASPIAKVRSLEDLDDVDPMTGADRGLVTAE
ncbi:MAG: MFS transporter, partial [Nocardioidaceae bacterium]